MLVAIAALVIVAVAGVSVLLVIARGQMLAGVSQLDSMRSIAAVSKASHLRAELPRLSRALRAAHANFSRASMMLGPLAPVLSLASGAPRIGDELAAAPELAQAGSDTTAGALDLIAGIRPLMPHLTAGSLHAASLLPAVAAQRSHFSAACRLFDDAERDRAGIRTVRSATLKGALQTFDSRLPELRDLCSGLTVMPGILGYPRPRTYLLAYQDPEELRATGGFIGSADLLTLDNGSATHRFQADTQFSHENLTIPAPEPFVYYNQEPFWLFRDSNWSPDFPVTAAIERYILRLDLHVRVQGVINLTPQCAADVLAATGPVYVPAYHRWVNSANVAQLADYYAHWTVYHGPNPNIRRKQFIGDVARHILNRQRHLSLSKLASLAQAVGTAVRHGDLLANFTDPADEAFVRSSGASGALLTTPGDYLYVVDSNFSYNKISPYVRETVRDQVRVLPDRWLRNTLTIRFANQTPAGYTLGFGPGYGKLGGPRDYADFLRIYVPYGSRIVRQSGWRNRWTPGPAYGKMMFCGYLIVRDGATRTVRITYLVPPNVFTWSNGTRYRLSVQHQPGNLLDELNVSVAADGRSHSWSVPHPTTDWKVSVPIAHHSFHSVQLPQPPPTLATPGHWIEPHTYLAPEGYLPHPPAG
ncbi:MAG TPA: DUF4012 domain-containing protein [Chloroflexota bacterium]|nr:DUF4012 domain-containing protein [Chloroflexota bacterium]